MGAHGTVFEARDRELDRLVAIKLYALAPGALVRFEREVSRLAAVKHPNLVEIYQTGQCAGTPWMAMRLVEGRPLSAWLRDAGPGPVTSLVQVAGALEAIHGAGLVHRDVKPQNIMVEPGGTSLLVDFGCIYDARAETLTASGVVLGTAGYLPPEAFRGAPTEPAWDWFAWGASLYALHTGRTPWNLEHMMAYGCGGELPPLTRPEGWDDEASWRLAAACLAVDDRLRPASAAGIEAILTGRDPARSPDPAALGTTRVPPRRQGRGRGRGMNPGFAGWSVGAAVAAAMAGAMLVARPGQDGVDAGRAEGPREADGGREVDRVARGRPGDESLPAIGAFLLGEAEGRPGFRVPAPCRGPEGDALVATGILAGWGEGRLLGWFGGELVVYDEVPPAVRAMARPTRPTLFLPGPGAGLRVLHPEHLENPGAAPVWDPGARTPAPGACFPVPAVLPGDPDDPLAWKVADALLPLDRPLARALPQEAGEWRIHDLPSSVEGEPRRLLLARPGESPLRLELVDGPDWHSWGEPGADPVGGAVLLPHRHAGGGFRLTAVDPGTGRIRFRLKLPQLPDGSPRMFAGGLAVPLEGALGLVPRERLTGELTADAMVRVPLATGAGRVPGIPGRSRILDGGESGLHLLVPHPIPPGPHREEVALATWYRWGDPVGSPGRVLGFRLEGPRPPDALLVDQRVQVELFPVPGRPGQALLDLRVGWSRHDLVLVDLDRLEGLVRLAPEDPGELGRSGTVRAGPVVVSGGRGPVAWWIDTWGTLWGWRLP